MASSIVDFSVGTPSARGAPFIASSCELVYLWGGAGDIEPDAIFIYRHDTETWKRQLTQGAHPPAGLRNGGCTISGQYLYLYGGAVELSYHGDLYVLHFKNWTWRKVCEGGAEGPGKKYGCRMISYQDHLLVFGGYYGRTHSSRQIGANYEAWKTNEVHSYSLTTGKRVVYYDLIYADISSIDMLYELLEFGDIGIILGVVLFCLATIITFSLVIVFGKYHKVFRLFIMSS